MKLVLDSNVLVAAFAARGLCSSLFELCIERYQIIISEYILTEISRALYGKIKMPEDRVSMVIGYLRECCVVSEYGKLPERVCRDKNDDDIIALALGCNAGYLITGDKDLLDMAKYKSVKILSPRDFWNVARERPD